MCANDSSAVLSLTDEHCIKTVLTVFYLAHFRSGDNFNLI